MYLVKVIPLDKILRPAGDYFFYASKIYHNYLSLVEIPLRKKKVMGIVLECQKIDKEKLDLKKTVNFPLKNILKVINPHQVLDFKFLQIAQQTSQKFALPLGAFLNVFLPKKFLKDGIFSSQVERIYEKRYENFKIFLDDLQRYKNKNVLIALPDNLSSLLISNLFQKNNIDHLVLIKEKKKSYQENLNLIYKSKITKPILAVGHALLNPFPQISEIIIFAEGNHSFEQNFRYPEIDFRIYLEIYAQVMKIPLIIVDWTPSLRFFKEKIDKEHSSIENYFLPKEKLNLELKTPTVNNLLGILKKYEGSFLIISPKKEHKMILSLRSLVEKSIFYLLRENKKDFLVFDNLLKKIKNYILVTTPIILKPINWNFDYAIFLEPESFLFNFSPMYRLNENFFRILSFFKQISQKIILLTKRPEKLSLFLNFGENQFYKNELENRKKYGLPPFFIQAELSFSAKNETEAQKKYEKIYQIINEEYFYLKISPLNFEKSPRASFTIVLNEESLNVLRKIPPYVKIILRYY